MPLLIRLALVCSVLLLAPVTRHDPAQVMRPPGYYLPPAKPAAPHAAPPLESGAKASSATGLLDLNTATAQQLAALPGMGAEYARRVIAGRPYRMKNQLVRRGILPTAAYNRMRDFVVAHRATATATSAH